jgi:hypothetical protein
MPDLRGLVLAGNVAARDPLALGEDRHTLVARALADRLPLGDQRLGLAEAAGQHGGRGRASGSCQR